MILFHYVIEVLTLPQANTPRKHTFGFQRATAAGYAGFLSTFMTRGTGLPRAARALRRNRLAAAASRLAVSRKSIVWPSESTARYRYLSSPLIYICLVDPIALVRGFQVRPAPLIQFRRIGLDPAPDAAGIHLDATLRQYLGDVFVGQDNHLPRIVVPFERVARCGRHESLR
jgi:hypothetical protein